MLQTAAAVEDEKVRRTLVRDAAARRTTYGEIEPQLAALWGLAQSESSEVAQTVREQTALAFQQAPLSHCLHWLGQDDDALRALVWEQIDGRIARADVPGRAKYRDVAFAVLKHSEYRIASRQAAVELLARLKDPQSVSPLIESLAEMPRESWPAAGRLLRA